MGRPHSQQLYQLRSVARACATTAAAFLLLVHSSGSSVGAQLYNTNSIIPTTVEQQPSLTSSPTLMTVWQFAHRLVRHQVTEPNTLLVLNQFESAGKMIVDELDKRQNYFYNKSIGEIQPLLGSISALNESEGTGERFQHWLERTFDVSYQWAKNSDDEHYRNVALDFKVARDWISGLSNLNRFTEEHLQIVSDFLRAQSMLTDWNSKSPATVFADFKKFIYSDDVLYGAAAGNSTALVRVRRGVFSPPRTDEGWKYWFKTIIDYIEDAVVVYNRAQTGMWPAKMAASLLAPPVKFIWTGVDIFTCLFEELYELSFAQSTEERWWDILLCGLEFLGVFPAAGVVKFGLRIVIRSLKMYFGIHTVPWYLSRPYNAIKDWWNSEAVTTAVTVAVASAVLEIDYDVTTSRPLIIGSMSG